MITDKVKNIKGKVLIFKNGELVESASNLVTKSGMNVLLKILATGRYAIRTISVAGGTEPTTLDTTSLSGYNPISFAVSNPEIISQVPPKVKVSFSISGSSYLNRNLSELGLYAHSGYTKTLFSRVVLDSPIFVAASDVITGDWFLFTESAAQGVFNEVFNEVFD